ncbi:hypothetical protein ACVIRO_005405 [Rhizobium ruizarguesonis]
MTCLFCHDLPLICARQQALFRAKNLRLHTFVREFLFSIPLRAEQDFLGDLLRGPAWARVRRDEQSSMPAGPTHRNHSTQRATTFAVTPYGPAGRGSCGPACPNEPKTWTRELNRLRFLSQHDDRCGAADDLEAHNPCLDIRASRLNSEEVWRKTLRRSRARSDLLLLREISAARSLPLPGRCRTGRRTRR